MKLLLVAIVLFVSGAAQADVYPYSKHTFIPSQCSPSGAYANPGNGPVIAIVAVREVCFGSLYVGPQGEFIRALSVALNEGTTQIYTIVNEVALPVMSRLVTKIMTFSHYGNVVDGVVVPRVDTGLVTFDARVVESTLDPRVVSLKGTAPGNLKINAKKFQFVLWYYQN